MPNSASKRVIGTQVYNTPRSVSVEEDCLEELGELARNGATINVLVTRSVDVVAHGP